jgi:hypothetical protein
MSLSSSILEPTVPVPVQDHVCLELWGVTKRESLGPYFSYHAEQCRTVYQARFGDISATTHEKILAIARDLRAGLTRDEARNKARRRIARASADSNEALDASIDLTARLLLMIDFGHLQNVISCRTALIWTSGSLKNLLRDKIRPQRDLCHDGIKLEPAFKVADFGRIASIRVELTTNIYDHLRFRDHGSIVTIFHHASFLKSQLK